MIIGVPKEICPGETRVALVPANVAVLLKKEGLQILVENGAGDASGYTDADYTAAGATLASRDDIYGKADIVLQVQTPGSNKQNGEEDLKLYREGQIVIGMMDPLANPAFAKTSRKCPPFCIQPSTLAPGVETIGEVELIDYVKRMSDGDDSIVVIDSRTPDWVGRGTIPGAINVLLAPQFKN